MREPRRGEIIITPGFISGNQGVAANLPHLPSNIKGITTYAAISRSYIVKQKLNGRMFEVKEWGGKRSYSEVKRR